MYLMGRLWGFSAVMQFTFEVAKGKDDPCLPGRWCSEDHKSGIWKQFCLSPFFLLLFSHTTLSGVRKQPVCAAVSVCKVVCCKQPLYCFFFSFSELIESWSTVEEISHKLQGDYCNELQLYSIPLHAIMGWGKKKVLLLVLSLQKSASRAGADFMNDAFWMKHFLKARAKCGASDNAITGAVIFFQQLPCCMWIPPAQ